VSIPRETDVRFGLRRGVLSVRTQFLRLAAAVVAVVTVVTVGGAGWKF
jgi:hypothetical protein